MIVAFLYSGTTNIFAQSTYGGFFPEAALTKQLSERYFIKTKIESQHGLFGETTRRAEGESYFHYRTDLQGFVGYQLLPKSKVAFGYQYRFDPEGTHHRTIQQIAFQPDNKRWQHRVRTDQTFEKRESITWRIRYRMRYSKHFPHSNVYILLSNEALYAFQDQTCAWENRLVLSLGRNLRDKSRLEIGPDYRIDADLGGELRTRWWLKVGWFYSIKK